jgi:hypothetical protein
MIQKRFGPVITVQFREEDEAITWANAPATGPPLVDA